MSDYSAVTRELTADDIGFTELSAPAIEATRQILHGDANPVVDDHLRAAGMYALLQTPPPEDIIDCLRRLVVITETADPMGREAIWVAADSRLRELGVRAGEAGRLISAARRAVPAVSDAPERRGHSQATRLVDLALSEGAELWHTPTGDLYMTICVAGHREHCALGGRAIRDWLSRLHHQQTHKVPGALAIANALGTLGGMARYDGAEHEVHVRVAGRNGTVYLDLGDPTWRAVEISPDGYRLVAEPPVRFRRSRAVLPLPEPTTGGSIDQLREVIYLASDDDWLLLEAWLIGTLRPSGPYPVLGLDGEQGSGKSTTARMLRRLVDPSIAELRAEPREIRDLMVAAASGWLVALDNVSHLQPWLSDALCRISTGGAMSTRQLYTDGEEYFLEAIRPIEITGIASVITRGDLQDRSIGITLPTIPDRRRRPEVDLWAEYDRIQPAVLGAVCDAISCALRQESSVRLTSLPRMADFARWVTAAEPSLRCGDGAFLLAYTGNRHHATEEMLEGDPLALALRGIALPWKGSAAELLEQLTPCDRLPHGWPKSPRGLAGALRRLAPTLRRVGINVLLPQNARTARERMIRIEVGTQQDTSDIQDIKLDSPPDSRDFDVPDVRPVGEPNGQQDMDTSAKSGALSDMSDLSGSA